MTKDEFAGLKTALRVLRRPSDPGPRARLKPGTLPYNEVFGAVQAFLDEAEGEAAQPPQPPQHRMVRGYKLFTMARANASDGICFIARPHAVVETIASGKYTCLVQHPHALTDEYIFVPSSLMHEELTDEQLFSGVFLLCDVMGGDRATIAHMLPLTACLSRFERRRLTTRPGQMPAPPAVYVRYMPWFTEWFQSLRRNIPSSLLTDVSLSFGMPYRVLEAHECKYSAVAAAAAACDSQAPCGSGVTLFTEPEEVCALEFLEPTEPYVFDRDAWLPSVSALHSFFGVCTSSASCGSSTARVEDQQELFYKLYDGLQREYFERMEYIARRSSSSSAASDDSRMFCIWK